MTTNLPQLLRDIADRASLPRSEQIVLEQAADELTRMVAAPRHTVEVVEVSREELLRKRATLLDRIDPDVRAELEGIDFLLGDGAASAAPETSPGDEALRDGLRRVLHLDTYESETDEDLLVAAECAYRKAELRQVEIDRLHAAAPVAADQAGETRTEWGVRASDCKAPWISGRTEDEIRTVRLIRGEEFVKRTVREYVGPWTPATPTTDTTSRER